MGQIICDAETNTDSRMVAMGVVLECDSFFGSGLCEAADKVPDVLPWFDMSLADAAKLDRLDLITPLGHGRSARVWKAKWSRRSRPKDEVASSWVAKDDDPVSIVAKVVPAEFATSVAREYFIYTQIVPRLSPAAQAYFPKFQGLFRSGWDGGGFVLVMEDGGERITDQELISSSSSVGREAKAAFELLEKEGLFHWDERAHNVLQRADGRLFIVDWGEARFNPPRPAIVQADAAFS
ncbi:BQ5605_C022g09568 [Microbotryum silenes-dioicae]|uniref:BQ5605_C022g09568 protein n=1 Tax=Microbotryum silenes-dioicae TaxID=796604 RepID=A0A2X0MP80_9BASI|nr:BQ5605_C022g09568 [Microbotryum silenes-dioicae]